MAETVPVTVRVRIVREAEVTVRAYLPKTADPSEVIEINHAVLRDKAEATLRDHDLVPRDFRVEVVTAFAPEG